MVEDGGWQAWLDRAACRELDPGRFFPESGEQVKVAEAKAICSGCQVRDQCLDLAVKAAGDRRRPRRLRRHPARPSAARCAATPSRASAYRQQRGLAEQAHALASEVGLRQAAKRLGIHRDALKAAFAVGLADAGAAGGLAAQPNRLDVFVFSTDRGCITSGRTAPRGSRR